MCNPNPENTPPTTPIGLTPFLTISEVQDKIFQFLKDGPIGVGWREVEAQRNYIAGFLDSLEFCGKITTITHQILYHAYFEGWDIDASAEMFVAGNPLTEVIYDIPPKIIENS